MLRKKPQPWTLSARPEPPVARGWSRRPDLHERKCRGKIEEKSRKNRGKIEEKNEFRRFFLGFASVFLRSQNRHSTLGEGG